MYEDINYFKILISKYFDTINVSFGNFTCKHIVLYYVASVLIGVSFVGTMSYIFYFISRIFEKEEIHLTTSIVLVGGNVGVILTPVIMTKFPEWMNWNPFIAPFYMASAFMGIVAVISGWYLLKK